MSGYTDNIVARQGVLKPGIIFINKPLRPISLANKIRTVLNGTGGKNDPFPFMPEKYHKESGIFQNYSYTFHYNEIKTAAHYKDLFGR